MANFLCLFMSSKRPSRTLRCLFRVLFCFVYFVCCRRPLCVNSSLSRIACEQTLYLSGEQSVPRENAQASDGAGRAEKKERALFLPRSRVYFRVSFCSITYFISPVDLFLLTFSARLVYLSDSFRTGLGLERQHCPRPK